MNRPTRLSTSLAALAAAMMFSVLLAGCGPSEEEKIAEAEAAAKVAAAAKANAAKRAAAADPTLNMARAVVVGKSQAVVDLKYEIAKKPVVGEPIEIELAFIPTIGGDSISATIAPVGAGLTFDGELVLTTEVVKAAQAWRTKVVAHAAAPEAFYFTVTAGLYSGGVTSTRNFAIPIIVSAPPAPQSQGPAQPPPAVAEQKK